VAATSTEGTSIVLHDTERRLIAAVRYLAIGRRGTLLLGSVMTWLHVRNETLARLSAALSSRRPYVF